MFLHHCTKNEEMHFYSFQSEFIFCKALEKILIKTVMWSLINSERFNFSLFKKENEMAINLNAIIISYQIFFYLKILDRLQLI